MDKEVFYVRVYDPQAFCYHSELRHYLQAVTRTEIRRRTVDIPRADLDVTHKILELCLEDPSFEVSVWKNKRQILKECKWHRVYEFWKAEPTRFVWSLYAIHTLNGSGTPTNESVGRYDNFTDLMADVEKWAVDMERDTRGRYESLTVVHKDRPITIMSKKAGGNEIVVKHL